MGWRLFRRKKRRGIDPALRERIESLQQQVAASQALLEEIQAKRAHDREAFEQKIEELNRENRERLAEIQRKGGEERERLERELKEDYERRLALVSEDVERDRENFLYEAMVDRIVAGRADLAALQEYVRDHQDPSVPFSTTLFYPDCPGNGTLFEVTHGQVTVVGVEAVFHTAGRDAKAFMQEIRTAQLPDGLAQELGRYMEAFRSLPPCENVAQLVGFVPPSQLPPRGDTSFGVGLVWQYVGEVSLEELCFYSVNSYTSSQALSILKQVIKGLHHLHRHGLYHGGLGPSNIRVEIAEGESGQEVGLLACLVEAGLMPRKQMFLNAATLRSSASTNAKTKRMTKILSQAEIADVGLNHAWIEGNLEERRGGCLERYDIPAINTTAYDDPASTGRRLLLLPEEEIQKADLYRLGLVAVSLFSRTPICKPGQEPQVKMRVKREDWRPEVPATMPVGLSEVVKLLLSKEAAARPPLDEVLQAVEAAQREEGEGRTLPPLSPETPPGTEPPSPAGGP